METTIAFILGIGFTTLIAFVVLGVIAFFKVLTLNKRIDDLQTGINSNSNDLWTTVNTNHEETFTEIGRVHDEINRGLDSRLNKLENKITPIK